MAISSATVTGGWADVHAVEVGGEPGSANALIDVRGGALRFVGGDESVAQSNMYIAMEWDIPSDDPATPSIALKPNAGAMLAGLADSDRWWSNGRFCATNGGKTSEFFAVKSGPLTVSASADQTNLTIAGWAKIDYVPPQGGISMGIYTNR